MLLSMNPHHTRPTPLPYVPAKGELVDDPTDMDILCGKDKAIFNHSGNRRFRAMIAANLQRYIDAPSKSSKSRLIRKLCVDLKAAGVRFLKKHATNDKWYEIPGFESKEKVSHAFRDRVRDKSKAGALARAEKKKRRQKQKELMMQQQELQLRSPKASTNKTAVVTPTHRRNSDATSDSDELSSKPSLISESSSRESLESLQESTESNCAQTTGKKKRKVKSKKNNTKANAAARNQDEDDDGGYLSHVAPFFTPTTTRDGADNGDDNKDNGTDRSTRAPSAPLPPITPPSCSAVPILPPFGPFFNKAATPPSNSPTPFFANNNNNNHNSTNTDLHAVEDSPHTVSTVGETPENDPEVEKSIHNHLRALENDLGMDDLCSIASADMVGRDDDDNDDEEDEEDDDLPEEDTDLDQDDNKVTDLDGDNSNYHIVIDDNIDEEQDEHADDELHNPNANHDDDVLLLGQYQEASAPSAVELDVFNDLTLPQIPPPSGQHHNQPQSLHNAAPADPQLASILGCLDMANIICQQHQQQQQQHHLQMHNSFSSLSNSIHNSLNNLNNNTTTNHLNSIPQYLASHPHTGPSAHPYLHPYHHHHQY